MTTTTSLLSGFSGSSVLRETHESEVMCVTMQYSNIILVWPTCRTPAVGGLIVCVCESVSADMSPYCSAHDEWLIMELCMYVGYHDANNVSNFGGDPVTRLNFKNVKK